MNQPRRLFFLFSSVSRSRPDPDSMNSLIEEKDSKSKKKVQSSSIGRDEPLGATQLLKNVLNLNLPNSSSNKSSKKTKELTLIEKSKLEDYHSITGSKAVDLIIKNLPKSQLNQLLIYIRDWNTSHKTSGIAQEVLHAILRYRTSSEIREAFDNNERKFNLDDDEEEDEDRMEVDEDEEQTRNQGSSSFSKLNRKNLNKRDGIPKVKDLGELLDGIIPYTQRHLGRSDRNLMEACVLDYTLKCMDQILGEDGDEDEVEDEDEEGSDEEEDDDEREVGMNGNGKLNGIERVEVESEEDESEAESEDVEMRD